jgi:predicted membrane metal-binding protein
VLDSGNIVVISGLLIGLIYGSVGLLSGFCLLSGLRGFWAEGDGRLVRTYALAIGVAVAGTQLLAAAGLVDIGKSIYLQASFSALQWSRRPRPRQRQTRCRRCSRQRA